MERGRTFLDTHHFPDVYEMGGRRRGVPSLFFHGRVWEGLVVGRV